MREAVPFPAKPILADFTEELPIALHTAERTDGENTSAIDCEQSA